MAQPRVLTPAEEIRLFAGLAVQPFLAALVAFVSFPYVLLDRAGRTQSGMYPMNPAESALSVAIGVGMVVVVLTVAGVLPTAVWLLKRRKISFVQSLLFGFGFGNLPIAIGAVLTGGSGAAGPIRTHIFASLIGVTGAAAFWLISIRGHDFSRDPAEG